MNVDVAIIGAGPAGLCLARSLAGAGLSIALVDKQPLSALENPAFDAREIALTHASCQILQALGVWDRVDAAHIWPLRQARVLNGESLKALCISAADKDLGWFISNFEIRRAAFDAVKDQEATTLITDAAVSAIHTDTQAAHLCLSDGRKLQARLAVGCDSRFSETRRAMGISAYMHDFGRSMIICRMEHEVPHKKESWEWFDYGQTLALLPLQENQSSIILTLPQAEMARLIALSDEQYAAEMAQRFHGRLGAMHTVSARHVYPLVAAYANRFHTNRYALAGDAAVGMHPVTAHGFNFGLASQRRLARVIRDAHNSGRDIATPADLARYAREHRRGTLPVFLATNAVASLYVDDRGPARFLRKTALQAAQWFPPFKAAVAHGLTRDITPS